MSTGKYALLIGEIQNARREWDEETSKVAKLKEYPEGSREDFIEKCKNGAYDDVTVVYRSNDSTFITGLFDAPMIQALPESIKFICHNGAGYDSIDVQACSSRGISVSNTPSAVNDATADTALFLLLGAVRRLMPAINACQEGKFRPTPLQISHDPRALKLGILGLGGIGAAVAKRAEAFGMSIQYHNRRRNSRVDYPYVSFDELLATSDVLSLNLSLNPSTRHIIGAKEFAKMKDGIVLVNTARGGLVDEDALVKALRSGNVGAAGLDVFEEEPKVHPGLIEMAKEPEGKVMMLPHMGTSTVETQRDMELLVLKNVEESVTKGKLVTLVPEQKQE